MCAKRRTSISTYIAAVVRKYTCHFTLNVEPRQPPSAQIQMQVKQFNNWPEVVRSVIFTLFVPLRSLSSLCSCFFLGWENAMALLSSSTTINNTIAIPRASSSAPTLRANFHHQTRLRGRVYQICSSAHQQEKTMLK